jgi:uncharacterized protein YndB with AHSA1/START domain
MPNNEYQFLTEWDIPAPRVVVYEILKEGREYPRWWPDVYLHAEYQPSGRPDKIGDRVTLLTKGWLPYKLRWTAIADEYQAPQRIVIRAEGDFVGRGVWQLTETASGTHVTFDWRLRADKFMLRWLSPLCKPLFKWNHHWAMATGYGRLLAEAQRRMAHLP